MRVAFIIGNGFNYMVEQIILKLAGTSIPSNLNGTKEDLAINIREISGLWRKFDALFRELKVQYKHVSDEELIRMIYAVLDFLSNESLFEKVLTVQQIAEIRKTFNFLLIDKIKSIASEFRRHEQSEGYKDLKKLFPTFGESFLNLINSNNVKNCDFFTTNYDGILDTLLTGNPRGFITVDGFGTVSGITDYLKLNNENLVGKLRCFHIHGSYRYEKRQGVTYKTRSVSVENADPVMVFNNPNLKEEIINKDGVLQVYFNRLKQSLISADKLIILGNSMVNEPHLKNIIASSFISDHQHLYACSRNPQQIANQLKDHYNKEIHLLSTGNINSIDDLIMFFDDVLKH